MKRSRVTAAWLAAGSTPLALLGPVAGLAASLAGALPARGAGAHFTEQVISTAADYARSVFATDLDGDGDIDVLSASSFDDKIAWYENDGGSPPTFTERVISTAVDYARSVFATDLDGDGDIDVLSASYVDDKIAWYESDGGSPPTFTERVISTTADGAESVYATDLDGDGDIDVLSASWYDDKIAWYESDGGSPPSFTERVISTTANGALSVFAADMDGDGDIDVLSASFYGGKIRWYENDGGSPPTFTERVISTVASGDYSVFATDMDGDGDTDVLSASTKEAKIAWYENNGGLPPTFTEHVISTRARLAFSVFATDVDGDGDIDVLSASGGDDKIAWYENTGGPCGDGVLVADEECDDENHDDGDGCSSACAVENGFACTGQPSVCALDCNGNGISDQSDIDAGTSQDCTDNGIPDECEPDCNSNTTADNCDIAAGESLDCNDNGIPDECESGCETDTAEEISQDETVTLNPGGGSTDLKEEAQVVFTNQSGAGGATVTVIETIDPVQSDAFGLETLATTLLVDASLTDGELFMTVIVPFEAADLGGADPLDVGLVSYDANSASWISAVCGNTTPPSDCPAQPFGTRRVEQAPDDPEPTLGDLSVRTLGEHGVYWNGAEGFAWANVDHSTAFSPGFAFIVPLPLEAADDGLGGDYNRVGDFKMPTSGVVGLEVAIRVTLNRMYIDSDEDASQCPVRARGLPDLQAFEGQVRYLGPPEIFYNAGNSENPFWIAAKLQCAPFVRDWSATALQADLGNRCIHNLRLTCTADHHCGGNDDICLPFDADTIYYYGAEVVPCSIHAVQQATQSCVESSIEECFSDPLEVRTALWGDLWPPFNNISFTDIGKQVDAFKYIPFSVGPPPSGAPNQWRAMLRANDGRPGAAINWTDIGRVVDAFKTFPYWESGPTGCP